MNDSLVSIVIPVYNAGTKMNRCIRSLLNQTYSNLQIILVDDKSPDRKTQRLLKKWSAKDSRIEVICKKENTGCVRSRFIGIDVAKGEYVCFSDQDDSFPKDAIFNMVKAAKTTGADVVVGQIAKSITFGHFQLSFPVKNDQSYVGKVIDSEQLMRDYFISYFGVNILPVTVWGKLYHKDLFSRLHLKPWSKTGAGDLIMSMKLHPFINRMYVIPNIVYKYNIGMPGVSPKYLKGWLTRACNLFELKWTELDNRNYEIAYRPCAIEMVNFVRTYVSNSIIFDRRNREFHISQINEALENPIWQRIRCLKGTDYEKQSLVDAIIEGRGLAIYEYVEKDFLNASLYTRIKHMLLRLTVRLKM